VFHQNGVGKYVEHCLCGVVVVPLHFLGSIPPAVDLFLLLLKIEKCRDLPNPLFRGPYQASSDLLY
jgi:hypothetical protein